MSSRSRRAAGLAAAVLSTVLHHAPLQAAPHYLAWSQLYDDDANVSQFPRAIAMDARGNVFVTGYEISGNGEGMYTAKYDALDGHLLWFRRVNSGSNEFNGNDIAVDGNGDCVVTGSRNVGNDIDYYTIKYHGDNGDPFWAAAKTYNGPNDGEDTALKVVCDSANNVIVTGRSIGNNGSNSTGYDFATIKYDGDNGNQLGLDRYTQTSSNLNDVPAALAVDSNNNVYVAGTVQPALGEDRFYFRKLQASDLSKLLDIVPIDTGTNGSDSEVGATAIAVDSNNAVVVTGRARDDANHFGYFTIKFTSTGSEVWRTASGPFSADTFGSNPRPGPVGVAIGPDDAPIVTGTLLDAQGNQVIRTVKYTSGGFFGNASQVWQTISQDAGLGFGDTVARALAVDGAGNAIVVGESRNEQVNSDLYVAKYDGQTGQRIFSTAFAGSFNGTDLGVDVAVDKFGNVAALGELVANKGTGIGYSEFATVKLNRFAVATGDELPNGIAGVPDDALVTSAAAPAISDSGVLTTKISFKAGRKSGQAILVEGSPSGGVPLPVVKGEPAPVGAGDPEANWASFSDPVVAPDGSYAFAGKVSGPGSKASGVWTNLGGTLHQALRQGTVVPGTTDKLASVLNLSLENNSLVAHVKLSAPGSSNMALVRLDSANAGTLLLRTGQSGLMIDGTDYTVKSFTVLSPPKLEAGDGRWQGSAGVVARVLATKTADPKAKATAIVSITNAGIRNARFFTGQTAAAPITSATYADFGPPATAFGTLRYVVKATLTPRPGNSNAALIYSPDGTQYTAFAEKGEVTGVTGLPAAATFSDFSDPIVNTNSAVAFIGTLKGTGVKGSSNKAIILRTSTGALTGTLENVARTGDPAPDKAGNTTTEKWTKFSALALPGGANAGPIFLGSTNKTSLGLWARDSQGAVRLLIRKGDEFDGQVIKNITLLKAVSTAMSAPRSFDAQGSVAVLLTFAKSKTAILRIGIP